MQSPTPVDNNAGKKPRKPSTVWGGLLQPHAHSVALLDKGRNAVQLQVFEHAQVEMPCVRLYHKINR
jgi:hypothetical protein